LGLMVVGGVIGEPAITGRETPAAFRYFSRVFSLSRAFALPACLETVERTLANMCEFKHADQQAASGVHNLGRFHVHFHVGFLVHQGEVVYR